MKEACRVSCCVVISTVLLAVAGQAVGTGGEDLKGATEVVRKYLGAASWQDRLPFVADAKAVRPLMEKYYAQGLPNKLLDVAPAAPEAVTGLKGCYRVRTTWAVVANGQRHPFSADFFVRKAPTGWRVDWPSSVGHNAPSFTAYLATRPDEATTFRVIAKLGTYYNFAYFKSDKTHYNIRIRNNVAQPTFLNGYIVRDSEDGKKLFELLKDGGECRLTLALRLVGPDGNAIAAGAGDRMVSIERIVKESWAPSK